MTTRTRTAAIVTIHNGATMTKRGRRRVAAWLRRQAQFLEEYGTEFSGRFQARYHYR